MSNEKLWYQDFDEGMHKNLEAFKTPEDLAKSYIETKSMLGNNVKVPGKDAGEADVKKFYDTLIEKAPNLMIKPNFESKEQSEEFYKMAGRPTESSKYEADAPEGYKPNEDRMKFLKEAAYSEGLSSKQFKNLMEKVHAEDFKAQTLAQDEYGKASDALKLEWGSAYDKKMETSMDLSSKFFGGVFDKETIPAEFARGLDKLAAQFSTEDLNSIKPEAKVVMTPQLAQEAINEIRANPKHPFFDTNPEVNQYARKKMVDLHGYL